MKEKELPEVQDSEVRKFTSEEEFREYFDRKNFDSDVDYFNAIFPYFENYHEVMGRNKS